MTKRLNRSRLCGRTRSLLIPSLFPLCPSRYACARVPLLARLTRFESVGFLPRGLFIRAALLTGNRYARLTAGRGTSAKETKKETDGDGERAGPCSSTFSTTSLAISKGECTRSTSDRPRYIGAVLFFPPRPLDSSASATRFAQESASWILRTLYASYARAIDSSSVDDR